MLTIDLPTDVNNRLELLSLSTGRTMQFYVYEALLEYLSDVEEKYISAPAEVSAEAPDTDISDEDEFPADLQFSD